MSNHSSSSNSGDNVALGNDEEISLLDILCFIKSAWKTIAIAGLCGLVISILYLLMTPNQYEVLAQMQMARVPQDKSPLGVNVEEPVALIARMSLPTSFNEAVIAACGLQEASNQAAQFSKVIKFGIPKGVASVVELKVTRPTPEVAKTCAASIIDVITQSQAAMIAPMAQASKQRNQERLVKVDERLTQDKALLAKAEQPKGPISPTYFAILSEIRALEDERASLSKVVANESLQNAALLSPIYGSDNPVSPKKLVALAAGVLGGLFLGLLVALARKMIVNARAQLASLGVSK